MDTIRADVVTELIAAGYHDVRVRTELAPAWTTDWITERGRARLAEFGIAPPHPTQAAAPGPVPLKLGVRSSGTPRIACPQCGSTDTAEVSRFSSTACKAAYVCRSCWEPFDYFKAL
jgi:ring-1,2-phenylacetyl-CoA epoxidase subunit PaaD